MKGKILLKLTRQDIGRGDLIRDKHLPSVIGGYVRGIVSLGSRFYYQTDCGLIREFDAILIQKSADIIQQE